MQNEAERRSLRLAHLYPDLMNLYGDRGNIIALRRRCELRGIDLEVVEVSTGDEFDPKTFDLVFVGGGQDREQRRVAEDLQRHGASLRNAVEGGMSVLAVCGGYQLMGHSYRVAEGDELPGISVFDLTSLHPGPQAERCIGDVVAEADGMVLVGFENHGGRTYLGPDARPLARVLAGHGNNNEDRSEGAIYKNAIGTYLHGSLLPKNPALADRLISLALERKYGDGALAALDDAPEKRAHASARAVALKRAKRWKA